MHIYTVHVPYMKKFFKINFITTCTRDLDFLLSGKLQNLWEKAEIVIWKNKIFLEERPIMLQFFTAETFFFARNFLFRKKYLFMLATFLFSRNYLFMFAIFLENIYFLHSCCN